MRHFQPGKRLRVGTKRKYPEAFRRMAVERMRNSANICALAEELGVHRTVLYHWCRQAGQQATDETATSPVRELRKQVRRLSKLLGEKALEVGFFQRCLAKSRGSTPEQRRHWRDGIYDQIRENNEMRAESVGCTKANCSR